MNKQEEQRQQEILKLKNYLTYSPYNMEGALEYLNNLYDYLETYNQDITLHHLNVLTGIAENTGWIDIFTWRREDYIGIGHTDMRFFINDFIEHIKVLIKDDQNDIW